MPTKPTIGEQILEQAKSTREQVAALAALLNPPGASEDPTAGLVNALTELAMAIRLQSEVIEEMRADISGLASTLCAHD